MATQRARQSISRRVEERYSLQAEELGRNARQQIEEARTRAEEAEKLTQQVLQEARQLKEKLMEDAEKQKRETDKRIEEEVGRAREAISVALARAEEAEKKVLDIQQKSEEMIQKSVEEVSKMKKEFLAAVDRTRLEKRPTPVIDKNSNKNRTTRLETIDDDRDDGYVLMHESSETESGEEDLETISSDSEEMNDEGENDVKGKQRQGPPRNILSSLRKATDSHHQRKPNATNNKVLLPRLSPADGGPSRINDAANVLPRNTPDAMDIGERPSAHHRKPNAMENKKIPIPRPKVSKATVHPSRIYDTANAFPRNTPDTVDERENSVPQPRPHRAAACPSSRTRETEDFRSRNTPDDRDNGNRPSSIRETEHFHAQQTLEGGEDYVPPPKTFQRPRAAARPSIHVSRQSSPPNRNDRMSAFTVRRPKNRQPDNSNVFGEDAEEIEAQVFRPQKTRNPFSHPHLRGSNPMRAKQLVLLYLMGLCHNFS